MTAIRRLLSVLHLLLLCLAAAQATPLFAQAPTNIRAQLVAEQPRPVPGTTTLLALSMTPNAGWHGYWRNGGDAGFGLTVDWDLPDGVQIGPFAYPVPEPLTMFGLMNHVYKAPYALLAPLQLDPAIAPGTDLIVSGQARWLACTDRICVPESALIALRLTAGERGNNAAGDARFDAWRAALPPKLDRAGRWERIGDRLRIAVPLPRAMAVTDPHLFVATSGLIDYGAPQSFSRNGDWVVMEGRAKGGATGPANALLRLEGARGLELRLEPGAVPEAGRPIGRRAGIDGKLLFAALGGAVLGGLLLNLMPCVFPILSLKALSLARGGADRRAARVEALAYVAGAVTIALLLGGVLLAVRAGGSEIGWAFQLQHPASILLLLLLTAAIAVNLLGLFALPSFGGGDSAARAGGFRGGFATGALAAFVATPCSGPFMGAALGATLALPAWAALPIFGGLGFGLALPFLAIAFVPSLQSRLPKAGPWMQSFRRWMALPMVVTAIALAWLLWRQAGINGLAAGAAALALLLFALGRLGGDQRAGSRRTGTSLLLGLALATAAGIAMTMNPAGREASADGKAYSPAALAAARASGKAVFINFTADWCITCKVNEQTSIHRTDVQRAFDRGGVIQLTGDWTNGDPAITRALAEHGRNSLPLYLWYAPGAAQPEILPQILTPAMLIDRAAAN